MYVTIPHIFLFPRMHVLNIQQSREEFELTDLNQVADEVQATDDDSTPKNDHESTPEEEPNEGDIKSEAKSWDLTSEVRQQSFQKSSCTARARID